MEKTLDVRRPALLTLLTAASLAAGCGSSPTGAPAGSLQATTTQQRSQTGTAPSPPGQTTSFGVFFLRAGKVAPVYREVPETEAVGTAAIQALLAGPTQAERDLGITSSVPAGTRLLHLSVNDGTATVDVSPELTASGAALPGALAELTFTLTQFSTVDRVWVAVQGEPVGSQTEPLTRDGFPDLTPVILVEQPALGKPVSSPVRVSGTASVFEATLRVRLVGPGGEKLWEDTVTASEGAPGRGTFAVGIPFTASGDGTVVAFEPSAANGAELHTVEVPVRLTP